MKQLAQHLRHFPNLLPDSSPPVLTGAASRALKEDIPKDGARKLGITKFTVNLIHKGIHILQLFVSHLGIRDMVFLQDITGQGISPSVTKLNP